SMHWSAAKPACFHRHRSTFLLFFNSMPRAQGDFQLALGYWIVSHKSTLKKWWALTLMGFMSASFLWAVLFFTLFFRGQAADDAMVAQAANRLGRLTVGVQRPQDLVPATATILTRDRPHVDVVARVNNP